jgi:hypothetical protein
MKCLTHLAFAAAVSLSVAAVQPGTACRSRVGRSVPVTPQNAYLDANHDGVLSDADLPLLNWWDRQALESILRRRRISAGTFG